MPDSLYSLAMAPLCAECETHDAGHGMDFCDTCATKRLMRDCRSYRQGSGEPSFISPHPQVKVRPSSRPPRSRPRPFGLRQWVHSFFVGVVVAAGFVASGSLLPDTPFDQLCDATLLLFAALFFAWVTREEAPRG